jgi:hypothetical protein
MCWGVQLPGPHCHVLQKVVRTPPTRGLAVQCGASFHMLLGVGGDVVVMLLRCQAPAGLGPPPACKGPAAVLFAVTCLARTTVCLSQLS